MAATARDLHRCQDVTARLSLAGRHPASFRSISVRRADNGPSYIAGELADWLGEQGMRHTRGKPYHSMTQGKIENFYLPGDPGARYRELRRTSLRQSSLNPNRLNKLSVSSAAEISQTLTTDKPRGPGGTKRAGLRCQS
jgi:transposase InsO family protein